MDRASSGSRRALRLALVGAAVAVLGACGGTTTSTPTPAAPHPTTIPHHASANVRVSGVLSGAMTTTAITCNVATGGGSPHVEVGVSLGRTSYTLVVTGASTALNQDRSTNPNTSYTTPAGTSGNSGFGATTGAQVHADLTSKNGRAIRVTGSIVC